MFVSWLWPGEGRDMSTLHKSHLFIHPCGKRPHGFWSGLEHVRETDLEQTDSWFQLIGFLCSSIQVDSSRAFSGLLTPWYSELINIVIAYDLHVLIFWCHSKRWNNLYWVVKYFTFHKSQKTDRSSSSGFWHTDMFLQTKQRPHSSTLHEARADHAFIPPMWNKPGF